MSEETEDELIRESEMRTVCEGNIAHLCIQLGVKLREKYNIKDDDPIPEMIVCFSLLTMGVESLKQLDYPDDQIINMVEATLTAHKEFQIDTGRMAKLIRDIQRVLGDEYQVESVDVGSDTKKNGTVH